MLEDNNDRWNFCLFLCHALDALIGFIVDLWNLSFLAFLSIVTRSRKLRSMQTES